MGVKSGTSCSATQRSSLANHPYKESGAVPAVAVRLGRKGHPSLRGVRRLSCIAPATRMLLPTHLHERSGKHHGAGEQPRRAQRTNHPHEGSGGRRQELDAQGRAEPTIPMRGQEIEITDIKTGNNVANHPHEGSGDERHAAVGRRASRPIIPMRGQEMVNCPAVSSHLPKPTIPMRDQEEFYARQMDDLARVNYLHERSGNEPRLYHRADRARANHPDEGSGDNPARAVLHGPGGQPSP